LATILTLVEQYLFSGVPSNFVYDLIKTAWQKSRQKTWEQLFLEAFQNALEEMKPQLLRYGDGYIEFDQKALQQALSQDINVSISNLSFSQLTEDKFTKELSTALQERNALVIGGHNLTDKGYEQFVRYLVNQAQSIFKNSIVANEDIFRREVISETQNNLSRLEQLDDYLRIHHDIVIKGFEGIEEMLNKQEGKLDQIHSGLEAIKQHLGLARTRSNVLIEIKSTLDQSREEAMFTSGLCRGYFLQAYPEHYFLAQEFSPNSEDLRLAIADALGEFSMQPIRADDVFESGHILCKISGLIQSTPFGLYQLTKSQNKNVYLELGIALGLGRPFVLIKDKDADVAPIISGVEYFQINHYLELRYSLGDKLSPFITNIGNYKTQHIAETPRHKSVFISHGDLDVIDFVVPISKLIRDLHFTPIILGDPTGELPKYLEHEGVDDYLIIGMQGGILLDETIAEIKKAQYGIFRIDKDSSANAFVALGIALGTNCPGTLIHQEDSMLPADLKGLSAISFRSYSSLARILPDIIRQNVLL